MRRLSLQVVSVATKPETFGRSQAVSSAVLSLKSVLSTSIQVFRVTFMSGWAVFLGKFGVTTFFHRAPSLFYFENRFRIHFNELIILV